MYKVYRIWKINILKKRENRNIKEVKNNKGQNNKNQNNKDQKSKGSINGYISNQKNKMKINMEEIISTAANYLIMIYE